MAKTHPSYTINTTFATKDIRTAASVYAFTAAATARVSFTVKLTNVAGGGDYVVYLTHDWLGGAAAATVLPKSTCTAAAGETIVEFVTIPIDVSNTDVVNVMIDGLAGDSSVNGAIRIVADNPSVFEATDVVTANTTQLAGQAVTAAAPVTFPASVGTSTYAGADTAGTTTLLLRIVGTLAAGTHSAQTGDSYPVVTNATYGNSALHADIAALGGGAGAITYTFTVNDGALPIDGVEVWASTDSAGTNVVAGTKTTDALGQVVFMLDAGAYYAWLQRAGYNFTNPTAFTVS